MIGRAPLSYAPRVIGDPFDPEPCGQIEPLQVVPRFNRIASPGPKVVLLTAFNVFHGLLMLPLPLLADEQFT